MSKLNFFYDPDSVYEVSLKALERRRFKVIESNPGKRVIKAELKRGLLKPSIAMEIRITQVNDQQTSLDISSHSTKNWLSTSQQESLAEKKFIYTLYKCFDKR